MATDPAPAVLYCGDELPVRLPPRRSRCGSGLGRFSAGGHRRRQAGCCCCYSTGSEHTARRPPRSRRQASPPLRRRRRRRRYLLSGGLVAVSDCSAMPSAQAQAVTGDRRGSFWPFPAGGENRRIYLFRAIGAAVAASIDDARSRCLARARAPTKARQAAPQLLKARKGGGQAPVKGGDT